MPTSALAQLNGLHAVALLLVVISLGCTCCGSPDAPSIAYAHLPYPLIGGSMTQDRRLRAVGALIFEAEERLNVHCTATLVAEQFVLTAAHCAVNKPIDTALWFFWGDDLTDRDNLLLRAPTVDDPLVPVVGDIPHPLYRHEIPSTPLAQLNDLALFRLARPVPNIKPLAIGRPALTEDVLVVGQQLLIVGYGLTAIGNPLSAGKRQVGTSVVSVIGPWEYQLGRSTEAQKCSGDSGGPSLYQEQPSESNQPFALSDPWLIGLASRAGAGCQHGSSETRLDSYLDWIEDTLAAHNHPATPVSSGCTTLSPCSSSHRHALLLLFVLIGHLSLRLRRR